MDKWIPLPCAGVEEALGDYIDGRLAPAIRERVASHLATCSCCAAQTALEQWLVSELSSLPAVPCPEMVAQRLTRTTSRRRRRFALLEAWGTARWAAAAAATLAVVATLALALGPPTPPNAPAEALRARVEAHAGLAFALHKIATSQRSAMKGVLLKDVGPVLRGAVVKTLRHSMSSL